MKLFKKFKKVVLILLILVVSTLVFSKLTAKADSLIGFNEGTGSTVHDSSGSASGTITNAIWKPSQECLSGPCLYFDGTGDFVSFGDDANFDFAAATNWTVELWFKTGPISSGTRTLVAKYLSSTGTDGGYKLYMNSGGTISFGVDDDNSWGPDDIATSVNRYDDNQWHHVVASKTGTSNITLYINAMKVAQKDSLAATNTLANTDTLYVGIDGNGSSNGFSGYIDELKIITTTARTPDQVKTDYQKGVTAHGTNISLGSSISNLTSGLIGWWKMDETSSPSVDSSGNSRNGTWVSHITGTLGKYSNAATFAGTDDYINLGTSFPELGTQFTISGWVYVHDFSNYPTIFAREEYNNLDYRVVFGWQGDLTCEITYTGDENDGIYAYAPNVITENSWHYFACVKTPTQLIMYIDGVPGTPTDTSGTIHHSTTIPAIIGNRYELSQDLDGSVDELRVYNRPLSQSEIKQLYDYAPGPVIHYKLDEGSGTTVNDSSGNDNTGTIFPNANATYSRTTGKFGKALMFNTTPVSSSIAIQYTNSIQYTAYSAEYWLNTTDMHDQWSHLELQRDPNGTGLYGVSARIDTNDNCGINLDHGTAGGGVGVSWPNLYLCDGNWHHVSVTYDGTTTATLYKDGVSQGTKSIAPFVWNSGGSKQIFEVQDLSVAKVDDIRIYDYARTQKQILEDMSGGRTANTSPLASWSFDEGYGTTIHDTGPHALNLTAANSPSWTTSGRFNKALSFAKVSSQYAYISDSPTLSLTGDLSLSAWIKPTSIAADWYSIAGKWSDTDKAYLLMQYGDEIRLYIGGDANYFTTSSANLSAGVWYHIVGVYNAVSQSVAVYINGVNAPGTTHGTIPSSITDGTAQFRIGTDSSTVSGTDMTWDFASSGQEYAIGGVCLQPTGGTVTQDTGTGARTSATTTGSTDTLSWSHTVNSGTNRVLVVEASIGGEIPNGTDISSITYGGTGLTRVGTTNTRMAGEIWILKNPTVGTANIVVTMPENVYSIMAGANNWWNVDQTTSTGTFAVTSGDTTEGTATLSVGCVTDGIVVDILSDTRSVPTPDSSQTAQWDEEDDSYPDYGASSSKAGITNHHFGGTIDEVKLFNFALSETDVRQEYNGGANTKMGSVSSSSSGVPDNSSTGEFCPPGDPTACSTPLGWWKMDEGNGSSINNSGSLTDSGTFDSVQGIKWASGYHGKGVNFQGTDEIENHISIPNANNYFSDTSDSFTMSGFFKLHSATGGAFYWWDQVIFGRNTYTNSGGCISYIGMRAQFTSSTDTNPNIIFANSYQNSGSTCNQSTNIGGYGDTPVSVGFWHHYAVTYNGTNGAMELFIDGVSKGTATWGGTGTWTFADDNLLIYASNEGTNVTVDDLKFYNYVRTPAQIKWEMDKGAPIAQYDFDECSGTVLHDTATKGDSRAVGLNGTIYPQSSGQSAVGSCSVNANTMWYNGRTGKFSSSLNFDGTDDKVTLPLITTITDNYSYSAWVKWTGASTMDQFILFNGDYDVCNGWGLRISHSDSEHLTSFFCSGEFGSTYTLPTSTWTHVVGIVRNGKGEMYINGVSIPIIDPGYYTPTTPTTGTYIGGSVLNNYHWFNGQIDDVRIYNYPLTPLQVQNLYNHNSAVSF